MVAQRALDVDRIAALWRLLGDGSATLTKRSRRTIERFLTKLSVEEVEEAALAAFDRIPAHKDRWRYFCGLAWSKMRQLSLVKRCTAPPEGELVVGFLPGRLPFLARVANGKLVPIRPPTERQVAKAGTVYFAKLGGAAYEQ
jgi:hypothetical protein